MFGHSTRHVRLLKDGRERIRRPMKRLLLLAFCVATTILLATALAGGKGGPQKNFSVTIENTMSDGFTPTTIRSDGLGPYINGVDGVSLGSTFINMWPRNDLGSRNV